MVIDTVNFRVFIACLATLVFVILLFSQPITSKSEELQTLPEHSINIAFNPGQASMTGTSRIILPPEVDVKIYCGPLEVTGSVLEITGTSQFRLVPDDDNIIKIPASSKKQTVHISWNLVAASPYTDNNLISEDGITLAGFWHPIPDIDMVYRLEAELPANFTGISEADTLFYCKDKNNNRYLTTRFDHPISSINFAAGPYTVKYKKINNDIELAAYFFKEDIELADEYLEKAADYIKRYEELIGPFPYPRYSIVENRLPTGYGMPTYTLLGQAVVRLPFIKDTSLGHEILHSWFGNSVFQEYPGGNWTEGLTTYLADHMYAEEKGKGSVHRKEQLLRYASYVHQDNEMTPLDFSNASDSQPMAKKVRAVGYDKVSMIFHMLRLRLGDEAFFRGLSEFYNAMRYRRAGWDDIEEIFSKSSNSDLSDFFDQWLSRWDIPGFVINDIDVSQIEGKSTVSFSVNQKNVQPYELSIPVVIKTRTGDHREVITVRERKSVVEITVDDLPFELVVDPDYDLMRTLRPIETPAIWSLFLGAENKSCVLGDQDQAQVYASLIGYLESMDCKVVAADEINNEDLNEGSFIFLGPSKHSQGLFARTDHPAPGFTLDVRKNPLKPSEVMVLVSSSSEEETSLATRKLRHYGKYGFLHFKNGQIQTKNIDATGQGISIELFDEPLGLKVSDTRSFDDIIEELKNSKVVYVGETHNDMGSHILQLQVIQALYQEDPNIAIGMEMFPMSSQKALDDYIDGTIATEKEFLRESNYFSVWGFDYRYYREIINYARIKGIPLVALNTDKAIVSQVFQEGNLDGLEEDSLEKLPPERDLDVPGYRERLSRAFSTHDTKKFTPEKLGGFVQAQSIWDETMADNIVKYLNNNPDRRMVVIAGNGHVYKNSAIPLRVKRRMDVPQSVVSSFTPKTPARETGYGVDYFLYTRSFDIEPAPKVGIVLKEEKISEDSEETMVRIIQISPHGKAGEAGIEEKDIILAVDDQAIGDITDLKIHLMDKSPGDTVVMKVLRENVFFADKELEFEVELSSPMNMRGKMGATHP